MTAAAIAAALGDARREGHNWRCRCPLHGGRSLTLCDGKDGRVLVKCWGGCDSRDVLAELRRCGLLDVLLDYMAGSSPPRYLRDDVSRTHHALKIWNTTERDDNSIVGSYLARRSITLDHWPPSLRFHPRCPRPKDNKDDFVPPLPAMVALVDHAERGRVGVHCTYLLPDGSGKADIEKGKAIFGSVAGGAVRFGTPCEGEWLAVAEGIETALSVAVACAMPIWAALSASGIQNLILPAAATHVVICADHDSNGVGERAAHDAAARWLAEGRRVRVAIPPDCGTDFNDVLSGNAAAEVSEGCRVA